MKQVKTLTLEQVQFIEDRLCQKYDLQQDEIRNEILDHIACEIEALMNQGETYDEATILAFRTWNVRLISNEKGVYKGIPHFILNQLNVEYKKVELKSLLIAAILSIPLLLAMWYLNFNPIGLMSSLFVINVCGVLVIYKESKKGQDYRYDFFRGKALKTLIKSAIPFLFVAVFYILWGTYDNLSNFSFLLIFYFVFNSFLLFRFRKYGKYQKFKLAK